MNNPGIVRPGLAVLSQEQIEQIHSASLQILAKTGIQVDSEKARKVFKSARSGATVAGQRVYLDRELVEWAIQSAPGTIDVFNRRGDLVFRLGETRTRFGVGVTNLYYQDPLTEAVVPFDRKHMQDSVRLADALPNFDFVSTIGILQDLPPETADLYAVLEMYANTLKPLVILVSDEKLFSPVLDLLERLHGDLSEKPFFLPYFNPITPLVMNDGTADKMLGAIERGLPVIYSNYSMAGMSTPITPAGTLALLNAELLAGLVLSQLARAGTPIVLGCLPAFFDMKTMMDFYDPLTLLLNLACGELMAYYQIPHAGTSGSGEGWGADLVAGGLLWMNHLTSCLGKVGLAPFVGGSLGSKAFSPSLVVYSNEVIGQAIHFARGFSLDDETLAVDEVARAGPGGSFIGSDLTLKYFRQAYFKSEIFPRLSLEKWRERNQPKVVDHLKEYTLGIMTTRQPLEDHDDVIAKGDAFIQSYQSER